MSSPSEGDFKEFILSDKLSDLENYNADNVLTDELKEIYADVQLKCNDFRNNVFFKNIDNIDEELVSYKIYLIYKNFIQIGKTRFKRYTSLIWFRKYRSRS